MEAISRSAAVVVETRNGLGWEDDIFVVVGYIALVPPGFSIQMTVGLLFCGERKI